MENLRCNICGSEKISTQKHLKRHINHEHVQDFEYKCVCCPMTNVFLDNTKRHIRNKHCIKKGEENSYYVIQPRKLSTQTIVTILQKIQWPWTKKYRILNLQPTSQRNNW